jgi:hypothetical protein
MRIRIRMRMRIIIQKIVAASFVLAMFDLILNRKTKSKEMKSRNNNKAYKEKKK